MTASHKLEEEFRKQRECQPGLGGIHLGRLKQEEIVATMKQLEAQVDELQGGMLEIQKLLGQATTHDPVLVTALVNGIMENYPEAGVGSALICIEWHYKDGWYRFRDAETDKVYQLEMPRLLAVVPLMFTDKWPKGCTPLPCRLTKESVDEWLCQADATDFDAFVQLACLGEVIYG